MATEIIRVGIIGANVRYGWGRDTHVPALSALAAFEITAVCTRRHETVDETAKHFGGRSVSPDFDVVVKRHQLLDVIQKASDTGIRQIH
jgi:predicted dehydrogenase